MSTHHEISAASQEKRKKRKHKDERSDKSLKKRRKLSNETEDIAATAQTRGSPARDASSEITPSAQDHTTSSSTPHSEKTRKHAIEADPWNLTKVTANSPFMIQRTSFYLPISPIYQQHPVDGLCAEHLSPLLLTYFQPLNGIILSYSNPYLSNEPARHKPVGIQVNSEAIDEYGVTYIWLTADFLMLRPEQGVELEGHIGVQSEGQLGLVCWNLFNASISSDNLPKGWYWHNSRKADSRPSAQAEDGEADDDGTADGHYVDGTGKKVEGLIKFRVRDFESLPSFGKDKNFISIDGTLLSEEEEKKQHPGGQTQRKNTNNRNRVKQRTSKKTLGAEQGVGSTSAGVLVNGDNHDS